MCGVLRALAASHHLPSHYPCLLGVVSVTISATEIVGDSDSSGDGGGYNNGFERGTSDFQLRACQPLHHRHKIEVI